MYIMHKSNGIINLNDYPRFDVLPRNDTHKLVAYIKPESDIDIEQNNRYEKRSMTIIEYQNEVDARYCLWNLWNSIRSNKKIWDFDKIRLPSDMWKKTIDVFQNEAKSLPNDFLLNTKLQWEGLNTLIINHNVLLEHNKENIKKELEDIKCHFATLLSECRPNIKWDSFE